MKSMDQGIYGAPESELHADDKPKVDAAAQLRNAAKEQADEDATLKALADSGAGDIEDGPLDEGDDDDDSDRDGDDDCD